jgi:hypothetical protein
MNLRFSFFLILIAMIRQAAAYDVEDSKSGGFSVSASKFVYIKAPDGTMFQVTKFPFVGDGYSLPPRGPIICAWDPTHTWLCIFVTADKMTEVHLFNLKQRAFATVNFNWTKYPDWFQEKDQLLEEVRPVRWDGNKLFIDTVVKFQDGGSKHLPGVLTINDGVGQVMPDRS